MRTTDRMATSRAFARLAALVCLAWLGSVVIATADDGELKRRGFLGVRIGPVAPEIRKTLELEPGAGLAVMDVVAGSSAEGTFKAGDVVVNLDGQPVQTAMGFVRQLSKRKAGDVLKIAYIRDGKRADAELALKESPRETSDSYDVSYGAVNSKAGRLRTIIAKPKDKAQGGKRPALMLLQGIGMFTMEKATGGFEAYPAIVEDFAKRGFVVMRVDKPGCGDSEGGPIQDVDFETQLDGFRQALKALKADPDVDPDKILLFGHSMGGLWAPVLAQEIPVYGIAVYGTAVEPWGDYLIENKRRQLGLAQAPEAEIDTVIKDEIAGMKLILQDKLSPEQAAAKQPDLENWVRATWQDGKYYSGCNYQFFQQLSEIRPEKLWEKFQGHVLAVWGQADFVGPGADHKRIAEIVDRAHPGHGKFVALENSDHGFFEAKTLEDSFQRHGAPAKFNPAIIAELRKWSESLKG